MSVLFVGTTAEDFIAAGIEGPGTATTTNSRDSDYSPYEIGATSSGGNPFGFSFAATADLWVHFRTWFPEVRLNGTDGDLFEIYNADDDLLCVGDFFDDDIRARVFGDTTVNGSYSAITGETVYTVDVHCQVDASNIQLDIYFNGVLVSTATAANTTGSLSAPTVFTFTNNDIGTPSGEDPQDTYYSEIIITDGEDTRGWRLACLEPDAAGNYTAWDGDYTDLAGSSLSTAIAADTDGLRHSSNVGAYGGPASPAGIRGVFASCVASKGSSGPGDLKQFLRIGSTDYDGSAVTLGEGNAVYIEEWATNPAGGAWATSDFAALQVGVKAET